VTQTTEAKKKKRKRTRPMVSVDTTLVSFGVETINVGDDEEDDVERDGGPICGDTSQGDVDRRIGGGDALSTVNN
jgi:hypothetical protein